MTMGDDKTGWLRAAIVAAMDRANAVGITDGRLAVLAGAHHNSPAKLRGGLTVRMDTVEGYLDALGFELRQVDPPGPEWGVKRGPQGKGA